MWGKAILVLVFCCDADTAGGDGCQKSAVALAGSPTGALAVTLDGNAKGALANVAAADDLLSAMMP